MNIFSYEVVI